MKLDKELYSATETAAILGKARSQINIDIRLGKIKAELVGKSYIIKKEELERLLKIAG
jgi:hypothetical protein